MNITEISIGSGGARGVVALGALEVLQSERLLSRVRVYHGTSVGALLCAGLILGTPCRTILGRLIKHPLEVTMECDDGFGLDSGKSLVRFIRRVLRISSTMTLQDLHNATGKTLYVCVCNVTQQRIEYWSHITHPDMSLLKALRCSCNIPVLFRPVKIGTDMYVDGAVGRHVPTTQHPNTTLSIYFSSARAHMRTWPEYLAALSTIRDSVRSRYTLPLQTSIDPLSLHVTKELGRECFEHGRTQALLFIKKNM